MGSNADLARSLYDAFAQGDVPTVLGAFDEKIEWREAESNPYSPAGGGAWIGGDAITQNLFMKLATEWDGFKVMPERYRETEEGVVVEGRYAGTYKETGKSLDAQFCHVWELRDGKITSFQQYTDTAGMQAAMGD